MSAERAGAGPRSRWAPGPSCRPPSGKPRASSTRRCASLPPEKKEDVRQQWEQYQSLPPEKKQELATRPPPTGRSPCAAQRRGRRRVPPPPPPPPPRHASPHGLPARPDARRPSEAPLTLRAEPAPLARRYAALCYEGLLLAAIVLVVGFLTLPALPAGGGEGGLVLPPLPARVLSRLPRLRRGRTLFHLVVDGRAPDAADEDVASRARARRRPDRRRADRRRSLPRRVDRPRGLARRPRRAAAGEPRRARRDGSSPSAICGRSSIRDRQFLHDRIAGTRIVMASPDPASASPAPRPR